MREPTVPADFEKIAGFSRGMQKLGKVAAKAQELRALSKEIIDCGLGEASHGLMPQTVAAGKKALESSEFYYVRPTQGLPGLRDKLAAKISADVGQEVSAQNIFVTPGSELGMDLLLRSLVGPDDEAIIFDPYFIPFAAFVVTYGAKPVFVDTYESGFLPDLSALEKAVTSKTKLIIVNSPNNPTGRIYPREIIESICRLAKEKNLVIVSDEAYRFFDYEKKFTSPFTFYPEGTVILRTFSKEYSMMGYKVGYIVAPAWAAERLRIIQFPGWGAPRISSLMAEAAVSIPLPPTMLRGYQQIRNKLAGPLRELKLVDYLPEGAFYYYLKSPSGDGLAFAMQLAEEGLLVVPAFSNRETHVRLSYGALPAEKIDRVIEILSHV